jgi:hypothetical protein
MTSFLRNCWYVAAYAHELDADFLARRFLDQPVLLLRTAVVGADGRGMAIALDGARDSGPPVARSGVTALA